MGYDAILFQFGVITSKIIERQSTRIEPEIEIEILMHRVDRKPEHAKAFPQIRLDFERVRIDQSTLVIGREVGYLYNRCLTVTSFEVRLSIKGQDVDSLQCKYSTEMNDSENLQVLIPLHPYKSACRFQHQ